MPPAWCRSVGDVAAARLQVGDQWRAVADRVEVVDGERRRRLRGRCASRCSTALVEPPVATTPAMAFSNASRVRMSRGRTPRCSRSIDQRAGALRRPRPWLEHAPGRWRCRTARCRGTRSAIAIVLAVNWPPQAPAPGQAWSSRSRSSRVAHLAGRVRADRLEHVLDRDVVALERARRDRAAVEHDAREVQPRQRHQRAGDRLVAAAQHHHARRGDGRARPARSSRR